MTVSITYVVQEPPGNTVTGSWDPTAPAVPFARNAIADTKLSFDKYVAMVRSLGLVEETPEGPRWIAPHCIQQIQEERP